MTDVKTSQPVAAPAATNPGKTLGVVALILSFFAQLFGLILGIIALSKSRSAGFKNPAAVWAIILSILIPIIVVTILAVTLGGVAAQCAELGQGVHELDNGVTVTCG